MNRLSIVILLCGLFCPFLVKEFQVFDKKGNDSSFHVKNNPDLTSGLPAGSVLISLLFQRGFSYADALSELVTINDDSTQIWDIEIDRNGNLYVKQHQNGLMKFTNNSWVQVLPPFCDQIGFDNTNDILLVGLPGRIGQYSDGVWTYFEYDPGLHPITYIDASQENIVWATSCCPWENAGVRRFDFNTHAITAYDQSDGLSYPGGRIIETTSDGHVWVSHTNIDFCESCVYEGVSHFDGEKWEIFTEENGLPYREVRSIVAFSATEAYIGTHKGIVKYDGESLKPFDDVNVDTMTKGLDGSLWVAGGVPQWGQVYMRYHNGDVDLYDRYNLYPLVTFVVDNNNTVWSITCGQLYKIVLTGHELAVDAQPEEQPLTLSAAPNPFNPVTNISFYMPADSDVRLTVYNVKGQKIESIINERRSAGHHVINWDGSHYASGIYFCRLSAGKRFITTKMCLIR